MCFGWLRCRVRDLDELLATGGDVTAAQLRGREWSFESIAQTLAQDSRSLAALPPRDRIVEREIECLPVAAIGAVQPSRDNRLTLFMRDRRLFSVELERSCSARDFYSGFYVEQKSDGMMCADRDRLQSRTGSRCEIEGLKQMVVERD